MSTGRFSDAVGALRASADGPQADAERTRGRILSNLRRQRARRAVILRVIVPLAAVFAGSTAWAAASGYLPKSWHTVAVVLGFDNDAEPPAMDAPSHAPQPLPAHGIDSQVPAEIPPEPADVPASAPDAEPTAVPGTAPPQSGSIMPGASPRAVRPASIPPATLLPAPHGSPPASLPHSSPPAPLPHSLPPASLPDSSPPAAADPAPPAASDGDSLYAEAHRLHFAERNPSAALSAWDAYLRAAPRGRFAVEAHYNRALCLVRLGRTSQAAGALQPFADGAFGGYRQTEARALLDAMAGAER